MNKIAVAILLWVSTGINAIHTTASLEPIYQELGHCDEKSLVLLDVGGTLLEFKDPVLHTCHEEWKSAWFRKNCPNLTKEDKVSFVRIIEEGKENWRLVDKWPDLIAWAHRQQIKVMAFTKVTMDPSLADVRIAKLAHFNLVFGNALPELEAGGNLFTYSHGVIQTGAKLKGPVLQEVLQKIKDLPTKIIFVDDRKEQVESVEQACQEAKIPCACFHYTAAEIVQPLDESVAAYQLQTLVQERRWVPAEEVINGISDGGADDNFQL